MASVADLNQFVQNNDTKGFLLCYMQIVEEGTNLSIPTSLELDKAIEGWEQILENLLEGYTPEFLQELAKYWLSVVKQQGGQITENFAAQLIAIIQKKPKPAPITSGKEPKVATAVPEAKPAGAEPSLPKVLDEVASNISSHYYDYQDAAETKILPEKELEKKTEEALNNKQAMDFLLYYLSYAKYKDKISIPMSSVINIIRSTWEELIMDLYHFKPDEEFIKELSKHWFYFVNKKGLPHSKEKILDILYLLIAEQKKKATPEINNKKEESKKESIFRKIYNYLEKRF